MNNHYAIKTDILMRTRVLLSNPKHWTQCFNWAWRSEDGTVVPRSRMQANCWCAYGAMIMATNDTNVIGYLDELFGEQVIQKLISFNDQPETTHDDILRYIDRLITETIPVEEGRIDFD